MPLHTINAATLKEWVEQRKAVVIDVREPAEHHAENIEGTMLLPLSRLSRANLPASGEKKIVLHCHKGARGTTACQKLLAEDPSLEIYHLDGGIEAWRAAGFPVAVSGKPILPLDRQVQLTIGIILLATSLLGYGISHHFFLLAALIGVGLTIAGATGFCGLARLMAKMPWNQRAQQ